MKKKLQLTIVLLMLWASFPSFHSQLYGQLLSQIGPVDMQAIGWMKGFWVLDESRYLFEFTDKYAVTIQGVKYFSYKRSSDHSREIWVYTIVKSNKTGLWYFARGKYCNGKFVGTTSRMDFMGKNHFVVYKVNNPSKIYYEAFRSETTNPSSPLPAS